MQHARHSRQIISSIAVVESIVELGYLVEQRLVEVRHDLVAINTERRNGGADTLNLLRIGRHNRSNSNTGIPDLLRHPAAVVVRSSDQH